MASEVESQFLPLGLINPVLLPRRRPVEVEEMIVCGICRVR